VPPLTRCVLPPFFVLVSSALRLTNLQFVQAAKAYEDHVAKNGQPDSHAKAKEIIAGFAGAFIDREFETRGVRPLSLLHNPAVDGRLTA
jgi:hypothetical protein